MGIGSKDSKSSGPGDGSTRYVRNSKTISGRLHDELVMMDIAQGKYFSLNQVATRIWDLIEKPRILEEICAILIDEYDVDPVQCMESVEEHLENMAALGIVLKINE